MSGVRSLAACALLLATACGAAEPPLPRAELEALAERYVAAWSSGEPERVAAFFAEEGAMIINGTAPRIGRAAITVAARGFMANYPDLRMRLDALETSGRRATLRWTFTGTHLGPGGTGNEVHVLGLEIWRLGDDGMILESVADFRRDRDPVPPADQSPPSPPLR